MTQVIIFFGWLVIGIAVTLVIFGHVSIGFVYGVDRLWHDLFPSEGLSSLIWSSAALVPGSVMLGIGKLMQKYDNRGAAEEAAEAPNEQNEDDQNEDKSA